MSFVGNIEARELSSYYPDFLEARSECKFRSCTHEGGECGVLRELNNGNISKKRYENYLKILEELKDGKCSDTCPQCNAYEVAIRSLEAWDKVIEDIGAYADSKKIFGKRNNRRMQKLL